MRSRGLKTRGRRVLVSALAISLVSVVGARQAAAQGVAPQRLTVFIDVVVEDAQGRPVRNLTPAEIVVSQLGVEQRVETLEAKGTAGHYELSYMPLSGKAEAVRLLFLRPGLRGRGLDGPSLKPRVVAPPSPLEFTLARILEERPNADDFPAQASVLHFGASKDGLHHTLALEVPLGGLVVPTAGRAPNLRLQIFARVRDQGTGRVVRRFELDRALTASALDIQRLVWTGQARLRKGRYVMEVVAYEPATNRASVRTIPFEAKDPAPGLRMGSVALLQPIGGLVVREAGSEADDPFLLGREPLMPTLGLRTFAVAGVNVDFFTILYPDRASPDPVTLTLAVVRDGNVVDSVPLPLPAPDQRGEIRYAGAMPTRGLDPADYRLRLHAQQGAIGRSEEVPFTVLAHADTAPIAVGGPAPSGSSPGPQAPRPQAPTRVAPTPEPPELATARRQIERQQYDEALRGLKKMDAAAAGLRGDVALLLGVAYFQLEAYKDAEATIRRAIDLAKDDPRLLGQATFLLGRVLTSAEKRPIRKDSERLRAAEEAYRAVLAMPTMPADNTQLALAQTLIRLDRGAEAQEILNALLKSPDLTDSNGDRARQLLANPRCATEGCLPTLSFVTADGQHLTSEDLRGKVVLLSFWAEWCQPCIAAIPDLKRISSSHQKSPFVLLGVNMHDERGAMDRFIAKHDVRWPQISGQASQRLIDTMAVSRIPTEFLFDHEGVLVTGSTGWNSQVGDALFHETARTVQKAKKVAAAAGRAR